MIHKSLYNFDLEIHLFSFLNVRNDILNYNQQDIAIHTSIKTGFYAEFFTLIF